MHEVINLFPTPLYSTNLTDELDAGEMEKIMEEIHDEEINWNKFNWISPENYWLDRYQDSSLYKAIKNHVDNYATEVWKYHGGASFYFTNSWVTKTRKGEWHHHHSHPNSVISGVFYMDCDWNTGGIEFHDERQMQISIDVTQPNQYNTKTASYIPKKWDLILFPSQLVHSVQPNENEDKVRIAMAFNTFVEGQISTRQSLMLEGRNK